MQSIYPYSSSYTPVQQVYSQEPIHPAYSPQYPQQYFEHSQPYNYQAQTMPARGNNMYQPQIYYQAPRMEVYNPDHREDFERRWQVEEELDIQRRREQDYQRWRRGVEANVIIVPPRPSVPLTSSFVLQPELMGSRTRQVLSNYERAITGVGQIDMGESFKQMKEEMSKASYTYSQMINTILYNFKEILMALKEIEKSKSELVQREDFGIHRIYIALNNGVADKMLDAETLKRSLASLNFTGVELNDIELLFSKFSNERSSHVLSLVDFRKMFVPFYVNARRKFELDSREDLEEISMETQRIGARVIKMHLGLENSQEYYRQLMEKRLIDLAYCFDYIDRERSGVLNMQQLHTFLSANDVYCNPEDINLLIQRFNNAYPMGPQQDHLIKLNELVYELSPKSRYQYYRH